MAYTETKTTSYGSRVSSSFKGIGTGFILLIAATVLLWWNEGRAVHRAQDIKEVGKNATHVEDIQTIAPEGQLIHANGVAQTTETLTDGTFGVSVNALSLSRTVEYYQWVEHSKTETKEKVGGSKEEITTYTYELAWVSSPINSSDFKDPDYKQSNSTLANINWESKTTYAENVSFGAYKMPANFIGSVASCSSKSNTTLDLSAETLNELNTSIAKAQPLASQISNAVVNSLTNADGTTSYEWVHVSGNEIYLGRNVASPAVGDVRVKFTNTQPSAEISLVAVVKGDSFTEYKTKNGANDRYISAGNHTLDEMMQSAQESNETLTWILRVLGIILVCAAFKSIFAILVTLLKVLPFLANILNWGVNLICNILGVAYSLIIIALAWIFYRPLLGITLLVIAAGLIYWLTIGKKQKDANSAASTVPAAQNE